MNKGWQCPNCGRGLAPIVTECPCFKEQGYTPTGDMLPLMEGITITVTCGMCGKDMQECTCINLGTPTPCFDCGFYHPNLNCEGEQL